VVASGDPEAADPAMRQHLSGVITALRDATLTLASLGPQGERP
jgi:DNA-binding FadR family transcriptional regulator